MRTGRSGRRVPSTGSASGYPPRALRRHATFAGQALGDFGCGFDAHFARTGSTRCDPRARRRGPRRRPRGRRGSPPSRAPCPRRSAASPTASLDVIAVPVGARAPVGARDRLRELRRVTAPGGVVPAQRAVVARQARPRALGLPARPQSRPRRWTTTRVLRPRDLWPLLVRAGFKPSEITCSPPQVRPEHVRRLSGRRSIGTVTSMQRLHPRPTSPRPSRSCRPLDQRADRPRRRRPRRGARAAAGGCSSSASAVRPATRPRGQRLPQDLRHRGLRPDRQRQRADRADQRRRLGHVALGMARGVRLGARRRAARLLGRRRRRRAQHLRRTWCGRVELARRGRRRGLRHRRTRRRPHRGGRRRRRGDPAAAPRSHHAAHRGPLRRRVAPARHRIPTLQRATTKWEGRCERLALPPRRRSSAAPASSAATSRSRCWPATTSTHVVTSTTTSRPDGAGTSTRSPTTRASRIVEGEVHDLDALTGAMAGARPRSSTWRPTPTSPGP